MVRWPLILYRLTALYRFPFALLQVKMNKTLLCESNLSVYRFGSENSLLKHKAKWMLKDWDRDWSPSISFKNGWFQKISIPYHGWHEYFNPPLPSEIPKCLSPPCPPNSKIANPPSPPEFSTFFSDPLEFLFVCLNLQTNEKLALFPSAKEFCSQFLVRRSSNSSLLKLVHRSYSF